MSKLISVIVTVYNREKFLVECLDSLKNQTYKNFEAIIVDDGSTDNSLEIEKKYSKEDPRFKLIASEHVGFPEAKNIGLKNIQGEYIIFLDSDDSVHPDWLKILYELCENTGADISTCLYKEYLDIEEKPLELDMKQFYYSGIQISEYQFLKMDLIFQYNCSSYMWNKLIRKELYNGIQFVDQIALSDISVMYKIFDKANKVVQAHLPLIYYRRHKNSMGNYSSVNKLEYYKFRISILKEQMFFVWKFYPQSRRMVQIALFSELKKIKKILGEEQFEKYIHTEDLKKLEKFPTLYYINKI